MNTSIPSPGQLYPVNALTLPAELRRSWEQRPAAEVLALLPEEVQKLVLKGDGTFDWTVLVIGQPQRVHSLITVDADVTSRFETDVRPLVREQLRQYEQSAPVQFKNPSAVMRQQTEDLLVLREAALLKVRHGDYFLVPVNVADGRYLGTVMVPAYSGDPVQLRGTRYYLGFEHLLPTSPYATPQQAAQALGAATGSVELVSFDGILNEREGGPFYFARGKALGLANHRVFQVDGQAGLTTQGLTATVLPTLTAGRALADGAFRAPQLRSSVTLTEVKP